MFENVIVHLWQGGTLKSCQVSSPLMRLVEGEEKWRVFSIKFGRGTDPNRTVTCMVLKATDSDMRTTSPLPR
ncbi:hypothetical protein TNCV_1499771 [Trichonephila clavipes]|nr:hypothetical protein TNCV_1499771 [Trichonephila clavipes]